MPIKITFWFDKLFSIHRTGVNSLRLGDAKWGQRYISWKGWVLCLLLLCSLMLGANNQVHYGLMVKFVCLQITLPHHHHYADLSEGIELLKCLSVILNIECVSKIKSILPIIFQVIYVAVRIQLTHFSYVDCENMCTFILSSSSNWNYDSFAMV